MQSRVKIAERVVEHSPEAGFELEVSPARGLISSPDLTMALSGDIAAKLVAFNCSGFYNLLKRVFDLALAIFGLIFSLPLSIIIAILVKLDSSGPIFYRQTRMGKGGKLFKIWKFRTMVPNAESRSGPTWASKNDPRVTRFGNFLRKYHLDELPQLVNVIKGDMSLVGPRPERPCFASEFIRNIARYEFRLLVKPGITGLAQIRYKYDQSLEDVKRKLKFDLYYVRHCCLSFDLYIMYRTLRDLIAGKLLDS